jgi:hypothetical protein
LLLALLSGGLLAAAGWTECGTDRPSPLLPVDQRDDETKTCVDPDCGNKSEAPYQISGFSTQTFQDSQDNVYSRHALGEVFFMSTQSTDGNAHHFPGVLF